MEDRLRTPIASPDGWRSVTDMFAANTERLPDHLAVETPQATLTYAQLSARVEHFAGRIAARLGGDNRLVGVALERDVDLPAWLLAVLRVGGAYLPLDQSLPAARLSHVLEDAAPAIIVASRAASAALPPTAIPVLIVEDQEDAPPAGSFPIRADTLAYVIYTSGSTGRPKGVEIEHGALAALMTTMAISPGFAEGQRMMGLTRISFDLSVPDMFLPFAVGGSLSVVPLDVVADPERLAAAFTLHRPDLVQATPSLWRALLESGWTGHAGLRVLAGGEAMTRDLADRLLPCCADLWNIYGPTEATVWATAYRVGPGSGPVPVGRSLGGVSVQVADKDLNLLPDGETGEIVIGGTGVARGYRNRPDLTADRFVHLASGSRVYRTGDLGRIDAHGALFCLGRFDDQVKVNGFRIELGDIEAALGEDPKVAWCAVRLCDDASGEPRLVGYVVPRLAETIHPGEIKAALAARIPSYMVPDRIVTLATMPLTPNGKIDRAALPTPFSGDVAAPVAAGSDLPIDRLAAIWCDLLGIERVDPADDFFDLGGYSLMTVRLIRRIHETFGVKLSLTDLMRASTLAAMAARVCGVHGGEQQAMPLNAGGQRPPLWWLDAGPLMRNVMRELPAGQPALALNLSIEDEAAFETEPVTIQAVAARLRDQLVASQPDGPYRIGGWCRWGIVAFEVAAQLRREGRKVALLVLLDAERPGGAPFGKATLRRWLTSLYRPAPALPDTPSLSERVLHAGRSYRAQPYDGAVLLVRPGVAAGDGGWGRLLGKCLTVAGTSGDHETMVRLPHAREVAGAIGRALAKVDGTAPILTMVRTPHATAAPSQTPVSQGAFVGDTTLPKASRSAASS